MANTLQVQNSPQNYSLNPVVQRAIPETDVEKAKRLLGVSSVNQTDVEKAKSLLTGGGQTEEQPGFFKSIGQSLVKPFAKVAATLGDIGIGTYLAGKEAITGDLSEKEQELAAGIGQPVQSKVFGEITPLKISKPLDVLGTGAELASYAIGAPAAKGAIQAGAKGMLGQAFKQGAYEAGAGALGGLGVGLQEEKPSVGGVLASTAMGGAGGLVLGTATPLIGAGIRKTGRLFMGATKKALQDFEYSVGKALKPRLGKSAETRTVEQYNSRALEAFQTMSNNKTEIVDELSGYVELRNPKSLKETAEVLDATEQKIFQEYNTAAERAGDYAGFLPDNTVGKLKQIAGDKSYPPNLRSYAEELIPQIEELRGAKFTDVQERVKILNQSLEDFYRGATTKAKAQIDASVASALRKELDDRILSLTGVAYQKLRNTYGSLAMVKKDVARQLALEIRRNSKGLYDMTDIFTGSDILIGALTGNPAGIIRGVSGIGIKKLYKYLNDPNRYIRKMFEAVEKLPKAVEEVPVKKPMLALPAKGQTSKSTIPLPARGVLQNNKIDYVGKNNLYGGVAGIETYKDENGNTKIRYNPVKGAIGMGVMAGATSKVGKGLLKEAGDAVRKKGSELLEQAKKYKSAEEFVKAQGELVYHGSKTTAELKLEKPMSGMYKPEVYKQKGIEIQPSISLSENGEIAKKFAVGGGNVKEIYALPKKTLDLTKDSIEAKKYRDINNVVKDKYLNPDFYTTTDGYKFLKENGYDSIRIKAKNELSGGNDTELRIFDSSIIKDKSQLTDIWNKANAKPETGLLQQAKIKSIQPYKEVGNLTTKILKDLEGKTTVSKQYILDATNRGELKQVERDLIREALATETGSVVNVKEFADKVKQELLPLKRRVFSDTESGGVKYENVALPDELRGNVANYSEHIYESPIKTSAGDIHWGGRNKTNNIDNYFGHTRIEDMAESLEKGEWETLTPAAKREIQNQKDFGVRRVIEVQSDLYQKGNLEKEFALDNSKYTPKFTYKGKDYAIITNDGKTIEALDFDNPKLSNRLTNDFGNGNYDSLRDAGILEKFNVSELDKRSPQIKEIITKQQSLSKLQQYNDPTAHFRMVREEVKQAAIDGKTKLQFPTGETAMKIEGLGENVQWIIPSEVREGGFMTGVRSLKSEDLKVGMKISSIGEPQDRSMSWIITDVLGDGKFKAVPKEVMDIAKRPASPRPVGTDEFNSFKETFDISGKIDTNNPIYKFYEKDLGRYLTSKYKAQVITDKQGVKWYEIDVKPEMAKQPVEAFGMASLGSIIGIGGTMAGGALLNAYKNKRQKPEEMIGNHSFYDMN